MFFNFKPNKWCNNLKCKNILRLGYIAHSFIIKQALFIVYMHICTFFMHTHMYILLYMLYT